MQEAAKIVRLSRKPDQSELWLSIKIVFLGVGILGVYGFIVMLVAQLLRNPSG